MRKTGLVVLNVAVVLFFLAPPGSWFAVPRIDLEVYRLGAQVWRSGGDLYATLPPTSFGIRLPFTYPPVAAVLFVPFALLPWVAASIMLTCMSIAALVIVLVVVLRNLALPHKVAIRPTWLLVAALLPVALVLEPVRETLRLGQINTLLLALVVLDCLVARPRWPRGVLVGFAAAVKLTPAAFVLFFLLRGDRRAALTAVLSFLACTAAGFALNPAGSVRYWTSTVFNADRIGTPSFEGNQSINGVLARLGIERGVLWLFLAALVAGIGCLAVRRAAHPVDALGLNAFTLLLSSPVSWSHHWVWVLPALLAAARRRPVLAALAAAPFLLSPHWWWPAEDGVTPWSLTLGNTYVWCALVVLGLRVRSRHAGPVVVDGVAAGERDGDPRPPTRH
ncbi:glycosyltransferase 87 family protein [Actinophytocola sp.]|uniref:glycosyltransferase 87 family protein n=1 Tax=Actinophytocola sp. TaxID=1872138 RepID=UPI002D7FB3AE|nr:glycosyltransferase 87 family protein [Actinophytocola sp.]HET9139792.1 glycosyltransferase 87 family protein [Actinophytocola sp.]